jgi:hypothetical protein
MAALGARYPRDTSKLSDKDLRTLERLLAWSLAPACNAK